MELNWKSDFDFGIFATSTEVAVKSIARLVDRCL